MEYNNKMIELSKQQGGIDKETLETAVILLSPFAPHIAAELWERLGHEGENVFTVGWPEYEEDAMKEDEIEIAVQINGKTKATVSLAADADKDTAVAKAKEALGSKLSGNIVKEIYVPGRIINIVAK